MGRSRCGLRVSWAAVETASKPMYAKKTMVAPCKMPVQPNWPKAPWFGGMKGVQFSGCTNEAAAAMKASTTAVLTKTMTALKRADSLMPMTRMTVTRQHDEHSGQVHDSCRWNESCRPAGAGGRSPR